MDLKKFCNKKICVAVSGGSDSVALLHYLKQREKECGYILSAVHCEHGIRGEASLADMRFVERTCAEWGVPLAIFSEDCPARAAREKVSVETAARAFRQGVFARMTETEKAEYIATAHHKNDEAETVLFRIARGTSLTGAVGMREEERYFLRPFLSWNKAEILAYCAEHGLTYCVDETNADEAYTRNRLRASVLPALEEAVHGATENLVRFAKIAAGDDELLYEYARALVTDVTTDGRRAYCVAFCEKKPLFYRACLLAMKALGVTTDYTLAHLEGAYALQKSERGARCDLPKQVEAVKGETGILFHVKSKAETVQEKAAEKLFSLDGFDGGRYAVRVSDVPVEENGAWRVLRVDADKIPSTAVFRFRKEGDVIRRFGGGTKSLKKFFNEEKTPVEEREFLPMIAEPNGDVYVVCGVEISEDVKVDENTKNVLYVCTERTRR